MDDKKETNASIWIWVIAIGGAAVLVAVFLLFLKP
jgi:hypothetical protein